MRFQFVMMDSQCFLSTLKFIELGGGGGDLITINGPFLVVLS